MSLLGTTVRSRRSRSGRSWLVQSYSASVDEYTLVPLGSDVSSARNERTGKWQGGVRTIRVAYSRLNDSKLWERVL